jgi:hypothetical protein
MPPIFSATLRARATARSTSALQAAESPPPEQCDDTRKSGSGFTSLAGFFGGRMPLAATAVPAPAAAAPGPKNGQDKGDRANDDGRPGCPHGQSLPPALRHGRRTRVSTRQRVGA